jgi:ubiquinone/menaquinone biosynthesis C-methylase UbiE
MELNDAIKLINDESLQHQTNAVWADLGCGSGLFTYALANVLRPGSMIYAIDKSNIGLTKRSNLNNNVIKQQHLDFCKDALHLSDLDGILMANSIHFVEHKMALIHKLSKSMKEGGSFLIVEYDTDMPNRWVPFPVSFSSLKKLFEAAGYSQVKKHSERPSAFRASPIYSAFISR